MCHNKEVSFVICIFALAVIINLCLKYKETQELKYLYAAIYILCLSSMQLVEFFLHYYGKSIEKNGFQVASVCVLVAFVFQFICCEICLYLNGAPLQVLVLDIIFYLSLFYAIYTIKDKFGHFKYEFDCSEIIGCKLKWGIFNEASTKNFWLMTLVILIYVSFIAWASYLIFDIVGIVTFLVIFLLAYYFNRNSVGSAWCFYVIILMTILVISDSLLLDNSHI